MSLCFTLSPQVLATVFPFHFVIDRGLRVVQAGDVLQRLCFNTLVGGQLERYFKVHRPKMDFSFSAIQKRIKSLFILNSLHNEMQIKGQFVYEEEQDLLFFLGSPWITSTENLAPLNIKLKDFAIHDPIVDFVFLLQASQTSLKETKKLAEELTQQQAQLKNALTIKENLAKIAEAQANRLEEALKDLQKTQAQLVQTEKMSGLGQMVAGVAHEINNPVNFIHGNLDYVKGYTEDLLKLVSLYQQRCRCEDVEIEGFIQSIDLEFLMQDFPQLVNSMEMGTERIREIVASLRTFSRLDEAEHKIIDIHSGIDSTLLILKHRFKETEIKLKKEYSELPKVECYAGQLNQVFMNLISNAIDALSEWDKRRSLQEQEENPSTITITTIHQNDDRVLVKIADNGPGIPENIQSRLFDPFFTTKAVGKGTGLGLSISYQIIVDKHGGKLWCESSPENGAAFCIELPQFLSVDFKDKELIHFSEIPQAG